MKHFCSYRGTTVLAVLFTIVLSQRTDGYPRPWTFSLSYGAVKEPFTTKESSSHNVDVYSTVANVLRAEATTATTAEITTFDHSKPLSSYVESRTVVPRIIAISKEKRTIRLEGTDTYENTGKLAEHAGGDDELDEDNDDDDEEIDKETDDEDEEIIKAIDKENEEFDEEKDRKNEKIATQMYDNNKNNATSVESKIDNKYDANHTEYNDNDILIDEALNDNIFLTPEEFELVMKNKESKDAITADTKEHEKRAPRNPANVAIAEGNSSTGNDGRIVFPDRAPASMYLDGFARLPVPSCNGSTYCENLPYYPSDELVENALRINYIEPISDPSTIVQRMDNLEPDGSRVESLCFSEIKTIEPQAGLDENKEWHYILNNAKYKQKIEIEVCSNEGKSCRLIDPPSTYTTICKQKYVYRHLATISPDGTTATKTISMPSGCCCHVKFSPNIAMRMAENEGAFGRTNRS